MPWEVEAHRDFAREIETLPAEVQDALLAQMLRLREGGPMLGRPLVDTLKGSRIAKLKELRFDVGGGVWRVAFVFDGQRVAVLLAGGNKRGQSEKRFYKWLVGLAEARFDTLERG